MGAEWCPDTAAGPPVPTDEFGEVSLVTELEPTADGERRAMLYPSDQPGHEIATRWLAISADALIDLDSVR
ncbi:DUF7511 domain-containing protein [Haloarcula litorea]|uniref:DUF7511 domain-containing protein n=1 Tax=Haloarcula litorea TaxID=3032579 RepID=UPI0023E80099|nr:hypothetical protein [Halomicroarcula sp. GDY20]